MTDSDNELYLTVEEVANRLKLSPRQAARYADRVRTRKSGKRTMFHAGEVEKLAEELNVEYRPPPMPRAEMVPVGEMLQHQRQQQQEIANLSYQIGRLEAIIAERDQHQRLLTDDLDTIRTQLTTAQTERNQRQAEAERLQADVARLQAEIERQHRRPWWKRLLDT